MIYLVDIDGTIADLKHRLHFIEKKPSDWDGFFEDCDKDVPINPVLNTVKLLKNAGATLIGVTGRSDAIRDKTMEWLKLRAGIVFDSLYMRKAGDHRPDNIVKSELLDRLSTEWDPGQIVGAFEDRNQVVQMYRERGITVFQVADGDF